ncbi:MAG: hypothetical protein HY901_28935 [Deltaproteobacteria bacterium]|nr:hypothetical protein [Deltaproteobacteria bacterium]
MTKFNEKSFSVPCSTSALSQEELARRWDAVFGKKRPAAAAEESAGKKSSSQPAKKAKKPKKKA